MNNGRLMQVDKPTTVYKKPENIFVAGFIGTSNFLDENVTKTEEDMTAHIRLNAGMELSMKLRKKAEGPVKLSIRPEQFIIRNAGEKGLAGEILMYTFLGDFAEYEIGLANGQIVIVNEYTKDIDFVRDIGQKVSLTFNPQKINVFSEDGMEVFS